MQAIGSGHSSTAGLCLSGHEQLSASPFPFDRLHQEQLQERLSNAETTRRALSMVLARHPLGTRSADMLADLDRAGFSCDDVEDSTSVATGDCQTSYFAIGYQNENISWFGRLIWHVGYRASGSGSLENVRVWIVGVGL